MIQLNNLRKEQKELIEVPNDELRSVVGGGIEPFLPPDPTIPVANTGFSVTLPTSGSFQPSDILKIPQVNLDIGKGTTLSGTGDGSFGVTTTTGSLQVTATGNPSTGSTGFKANFGIRF